MVEQGGDNPSERVIQQRVRNRIIEYFELAGSFVAQGDYERAVPFAQVPYEVIEEWVDWLPQGPGTVDDWRDVYSVDEIEATKKFHVVWQETTRAVPDDYPSLSDVQAMPAWERLRREAEAALRVFAKRGKLQEDREAP